MDFDLSDADILIRQSARRIAQEVVKPRAAEIDERGEYPEDVFQAFRDAGLLGITLPKAAGGADAGTLALALAVEEVAKYCCTSALILLLSSLSTHAVKLFGSEQQQLDYIGPVARGEKKAAFCLTEPDAGSDVAGIRARAVRDGDDYLISGQKCFISGGPLADQLVVFAKTDPGPGGRGISAFTLDTGSPGFEVTSVDRKMGVRGMPTGVLSFDEVRVPASALIGEEGRGQRIALSTLNSVRPVVGARGVGLAEGALDYALGYARRREAFGGSIADLQAIQMKFADMAIEIEAARLLVHQGCWLIDRGRYGPAEAHMLSVAKAYATEMANRVVSQALQVLGGQGYMRDHPLERHYRDARQLMIVEGTSEIQRLVIARALLDSNLVYA